MPARTTRRSKGLNRRTKTRRVRRSVNKSVRRSKRSRRNIKGGRWLRSRKNVKKAENLGRDTRVSTRPREAIADAVTSARPPPREQQARLPNPLEWPEIRQGKEWKPMRKNVENVINVGKWKNITDEMIFEELMEN